MFKLILWLSGLLLAILTMNVTIYVLLSGVWVVSRSIARYRLKRLLAAVREEPPPPPA